MMDRQGDAVSARHGPRILVVGDVMLDQYVIGQVTRLSPEAPVPVLEVEDVRYELGGAANVAGLLARLGARVQLCGAVGQDEDGERLLEMCAQDSIAAGGLCECSGRRTTRKQRLLCHGQQLMRCDYERLYALVRADEDRLVSAAVSLASTCSAVVISDYGKGAVSERVARELLRECQLAHVPVLVDPKGGRWAKYAGASVLKPNRHEAQLAAGMALASDRHVDLAAPLALASSSGAAGVLTRGADGMSLLRVGQPAVHYGAYPGAVLNVVGAGDAAMAGLVMATAGGAGLVEAMAAAGQLAAEYVGTARPG